ncbi:MAG: hypothetical protein KDM64_09825, partial [Verrucomicrobiae bacterium]|nr:hypothetical protein [Verrucomicrobiae bacterium]
SLDDLRYEIHRRWVTKKKDHPELDLSKCLFAVDCDTFHTIRTERSDHRGSPLQLERAHCEHQHWLKQLNGLPVTVEHFPIGEHHGKDVPNGVGLRLRLHDSEGGEDFVFGYTGDTEYFEELADHLKGCDVLLAHISMPEPKEFHDPTVLKKRHLGYNGLIRLINETKPKLTLVGEFWAGLSDLRVDLIRGIRRKTGNQAVFPTGLGFHLRLPSLEVECSSCGDAIPHDKIKIAPAVTPFGPLGYLCSRCLT